VIGKALARIGAYESLDNTHQVVALINDVSREFFKEILELHKRVGLGDGSPPAGSRGGAPVGGLRDEVPGTKSPRS